MAPRKPKPSTKPVNEDRVSGDARVAKKPQRGFHRYRDGILNVKPKGKEERTCQFIKNQETSPLLRLPAEIRNIIWRYALGGKTFVATDKWETDFKLSRSSKDPENGTALLRTCRQLFLEAACYPITLGSFLCNDPLEMPASPLLRLPGELRNKIYGYVFSTTDPDYPSPMVERDLKLKNITKPYNKNPNRKDFNLRLVITQTCRQIRTETRLLPCLHTKYEMSGWFVWWLMILDDDARMATWTGIRLESQTKDEAGGSRRGLSGKGYVLD
ncbi:hypothetical protein G6514_005534 [Epicoccum nigrum]|nr:hypothetical protein G6514_005534 [Epicoccum nigrum]